MPYPKSPDGFVYFMQALDGGPIKIGWAKEPDKRLVLIQCGNPRELRICRTHPGTIQDELGLHRIFGEVRIRGEWFRPHPALCRVADAIPDPDIEDSVLRPTLDFDYDTLQRMRDIEVEARLADGPIEQPAEAPEFLARKEYNEGFLANRYRITALPEDMEDPMYWRNSSVA